MQDFTKLNNPDLQAELISEPVLKTPQQPKNGFIEARLNKDNFWNLVFGLGMFLAYVIAELLESRILLGISAFILVFTLKIYCKTTFTEDKKFLNNEGEDITSKTPNNLVWMIVFAIALCVLVSKFNITILTFGTLFLAPGLYFILINCPISVLFNLDVWTLKPMNADDINQIQRRSPFNSSHDDSYSPSKSYLPSNCYHRSS